MTERKNEKLTEKMKQYEVCSAYHSFEKSRKSASDFFDNLNELKKHIGFRLVKTEQLPENVAHMSYLGVEIVFGICLAHQEAQGFYDLSIQEMEKVTGSVDELFVLAKGNMARLNPPGIAGMNDLRKGDILFFYHLDSQMGTELLNRGDKEYILQGVDSRIGAGAILYPGVAEYVADQLQNNYFFLWLTVNEAALKSAGKDFEQDLKEMKNCVESFRGLQIPEKMRLSEKIYYFDMEQRKITIAG